jgi:hypothetical protein
MSMSFDSTRRPTVGVSACSTLRSTDAPMSKIELYEADYLTERMQHSERLTAAAAS